MASPVEKELAKHLECGICLEKFEEPKMLTCQHTYCEKCLERLVTRDEITCPECRKKTEVPSGDVSSLPSHFLINSLLSIRGNGESTASSSPPCEKHRGEVFKLFCRGCDQLICRDCALFDHRDHKYSFIKDIFPAVKEEISDIVQKSRANILALESSIETIKEQEDNMHKDSIEINRELDNFIDKQIELLEQKRQSVKDDLQRSDTAKKEILDAQMESFQTFLGYLKSSVGFTEETLSKGSEVEILSAKNQMIKQLTELNSVTSELEPRGRIFYKLELPPSIVVQTIKEYDEEYELFIGSGLQMYSMSENLQSHGHLLTQFCIRPKRRSSTVGQANKADVTIIIPHKGIPLLYRMAGVLTKPTAKATAEPVIVQPNVTYNRNGCFSFSYRPEENGDYKIEVLVNGRYINGSPFTWTVSNG